ncbi:hypothetical protein ACQKWADRAFT_321287 [Trichoderma austrokoningii]
MPYLNDSNEWRLLDELGRLLDQKKARYRVKAGQFRDHRQVNLNAEIIETELRGVFTAKQISRVLDATEFEQCQTHLNSLCSLLDHLARPTSNTQSGQGSLGYPRLRALTGLIESTSGEVDLASGNGQTLFELPGGAGELGDCLRVVTEYNKAINQLLAPPSQEPVIPPLEKQQHRKGAWKEGIIRNQAKLVLKTLFQHFKCGTQHQVLLKLVEDPDEDLILPDLQLLLSPCLELDLWQEARCNFANLQSSALFTPDICLSLRQHAGQGKALALYIEDNEKFELSETWSNSASLSTGSSLNESLDQLILKGVFRSFNPNISDEILPARVSIKDRRALAVKLGTTDLENFRMGHPALLSFAKLLLELDFGQHIEIEISSDLSGNEQAWCQLMGRIERLEQERSDSYVEAIRGCFMAPYMISKALRSRRSKNKDVDVIIRKQLYKGIVHKLTLGYDQSNLMSTRKRQRQDSPSRSGGDQASNSTKMVMRSVGPEITTPGYKKRRIPELQMPPNSSRLIHREPTKLCTNNELANVIADSIENSKRPSRRGDFNIAIICALPLEYNAISYIFDDAAASMRSSYTGVRLALLTGVCGSVPRVDQYEQIFLGDVIISKTVSQYDLGWQLPDNLITMFETDRGLDQLERRTAYFLQRLKDNAAQRRRRGKYDFPGKAEDKLFEPTYRHKHHKSPSCICRLCVKDSDPVCDSALDSSCMDLGCDNEGHIARSRLQDSSGDSPQPAVHVGAVASGDTAMRSAAERDKLSREAGVVAFETEGAGLWDEIPCIVVKGVCNYADSHNHPGWQNFAAATAAAASRAILESYIRTDES